MPEDNIQTVKLTPDGPPELPRPGRYYHLPDDIGPALCTGADKHGRWYHFVGAGLQHFNWWNPSEPLQGHILTPVGGAS